MTAHAKKLIDRLCEAAQTHGWAKSQAPRPYSAAVEREYAAAKKALVKYIGKLIKELDK